MSPATDSTASCSRPGRTPSRRILALVSLQKDGLIQTLNAHVTPHDDDDDDNHRSNHTGSVVARDFRRAPARRWKMCVSAKIHVGNNITTGIWNVRTLRAAEKFEDLIHDMNKYRWSILALCETRWGKFGEISKMSTQDGHKLY